MKKVLAIVMVIMMVAVMGMTAAAAPGDFVESPSINTAPIISGAQNSSEDCDAEMVITAYSYRNNLETEEKALMESAYAEIKSEEKSESLTKALKKIAETKNVDGEVLAVSDLFHIDHTNCDDHENHGYTTLTIKASTLKNFCGLMGFKDGKWTMIEGATVTADGKLTFKVEDFGAYAIVVDAVTGISPDTGDNSLTAVWFVLLAVSAAGLATIVVVSLKKRGNANEK